MWQQIVMTQCHYKVSLQIVTTNQRKIRLAAFHIFLFISLVVFCEKVHEMMFILL